MEEFNLLESLEDNVYITLEALVNFNNDGEEGWQKQK